VTLARATGATPSLEPFELSRVNPVAHYVDISGQRIDGLPMFDGAFTGPTPSTSRPSRDLRGRSLISRSRWRIRSDMERPLSIAW
jgi:hypothetical protein